MLHCIWDDRQTLCRSPSFIQRIIKTMKKSLDDFTLLKQDCNRFLLWYASLTAILFGIICKRKFQLVSNTKVIHNQATRFVLKNTVDSRYGLHQSMSPHWFINVHRMQWRSIKTCEPHIPNDNNLERIIWVFDAFG